jgi:hypothetical protein
MLKDSLNPPETSACEYHRLLAMRGCKSRIRGRSSSKYWTRPVEVRLPFRQLRESLEARLERVDLYRDLPRGRKRPNWKAEFLATLKEASQDIGDVPPLDVQRTIREYRTSKKEKPEITVVAESAQV